MGFQRLAITYFLGSIGKIFFKEMNKIIGMTRRYVKGTSSTKTIAIIAII
jgi:hypothetical protein